MGNDGGVSEEKCNNLKSYIWVESDWVEGLWGKD